MPFYNRNSQAITLNEWINLFEPYYFLNGPVLNHRINRSNQGSKFVENKIDFILENGLGADDLPLITAWKIGAIDHQYSENQKGIIFKDNFNQNLKFRARYYTIFARGIINCCQLNFNNLREINDAEQLFNSFYENKGRGLGLVYCLSLLYFFTQGVWPIYDKYVHIALDAISSNKHPGECVLYRQISNFSGYRESYVKKLKDVFGDQNISRRIDRALWVYGHFFA